MGERPRPLSDPEIQELLGNGNWVRQLARRLLYDESLVDDVVQDVWITALHRPPRDTRAFPAWLKTVVRSLALRANRTAGRQRKKESRFRPPQELPGPEDVQERLETQSILGEEVMALEEPYRTILYLRFYEDLKLVEIAQYLEKSDSTVRNQYARAIAILRERMQIRFGRDHWAAMLWGLVFPWDRDPAAAPTLRSGSPSARWSVVAISMATVLLALLPIWWSSDWERNRSNSSIDPGAQSAASPGVIDDRRLRDAAGSLPRAVASEEDGDATETNRSRAAAIARETNAASAEDLDGAVVDDSVLVVTEGITGNPVAGARVAFFCRTDPEPSHSGVTDRAGELSVPEEILTRDAFVVVAPGFVELREPLLPRRLDDGNHHVSLERSFDVTVDIVDEFEGPVAGVTVTVVSHSGLGDEDLMIARSSDSTGRIEFPYQGETTEIRVDAPGFATVRRAFMPPSTRVRLRPGSERFGRVVDTDGLPISECRIVITSATDRTIPTTERTDADGRFPIGRVADTETVFLRIYPQDRPAAARHGFPPTGEDWVLEIPKALTLSGTITTPDGAPAAGGFVFLAKAPGSDGAATPPRVNTPKRPENDGKTARLQPKLRAKVDPNGRYTLGPIAPTDVQGAYLFVFHPRFQNHLELVDESDPWRPRDVQLGDGVSVEGHVHSPSGEPRAGIKLHLGEIWSNGVENVVGRTKTRADGSFRFAGVPALGEALANRDDVVRKHLFVQAFGPDRVRSIHERSRSPRGQSVNPAAGPIELVDVSDTTPRVMGLELVDREGNPITRWLDAALITQDGAIHNGRIGSTNGQTVLYADGSAAEDPADALVVFETPDRWVTVDLRNYPRGLERRIVTIGAGAVGPRHIRIIDADRKPVGERAVYRGVRGDFRKGLACVGKTDESGRLVAHFAVGTSSSLFVRTGQPGASSSVHAWNDGRDWSELDFLESSESEQLYSFPDDTRAARRSATTP